ncbi:hypothetical protein DIS24_g12181 [Lasiodiplodia hormozganensis]|uniref:Uncharacterized protein n=1 Tax=Lasiodiplodia hormozganensis TaxID=869390 RepID=A0AA39U1J4_9PEZI|nr:hypothetical protein DIS24_g12181 [Lasiodiplodia hormozganensis]
MTSTPHCCTAEGHCRAQRFEMDALNARAAWEAEKAAIVSYEDGWDRWDGPIWPWRETNKPMSQQKKENNNSNLAAPQRPELSRSSSTNSITSSTSTASLWTNSAAHTCSRCGHGGATSHL